MHVLGFRHEHERPDRDRFLQLHWDNMAQPSLFFVSPQYDVDLPYDFESVTHLGPYTGARDPRMPVMTPRSEYAAGAGMRLGQTRALSASDVLRIQRLYGCPRKDTTTTPGATRVRPSSDNGRSVLLACDFGHGACGMTPGYESGALPTALPRLHVTPGHSGDKQGRECHQHVSKGGTDENRGTYGGEDGNTNLGGTKRNQETYRDENANKNLSGINRNQWIDWGGEDSNLGSTKMTQETDGGDEDTHTNQSWNTRKNQETYGGEDTNTKHGSSTEKNQVTHGDDIDTNTDSAAEMPKSPQWAVVVGAAPDGPAAGGTNGLDPYLFVSTRLNKWSDSGEVTVLGLSNRPEHHRPHHHCKHQSYKEKRRLRNLHKRKTKPYSDAEGEKSISSDGGLPNGRYHETRQEHNNKAKSEKSTSQDGGLRKERDPQIPKRSYSNYSSTDSKKSTSQNGGLPKEHGYQTRQGPYSNTDTEKPETKNGGLSAEVRALLLSAGGPGVPLVNASVFTPAFRPRDPQGKICVDLQVYQTDNYGGLSLVLHEAATTGGAASGPGVMEVKGHTGEVKGHVGEVKGHAGELKGHASQVKGHGGEVKGQGGEVIEELHGIILDGWTWMGVTAHVRKGRSYTLELRAAVGGGSVAIDDLYISDGECL
ncbi:hypothetical protein EGW08_006021 [Elysia chlorotica]|uniref:Metalloendopeptidase n=1 Tax=Elysia chlorotica TaxID=188477 RepID=A0A3S1C8Z7_ELYCH|nr:hypothetical protein EGW08_006021 [Elysia chlorotica]